MPFTREQAYEALTSLNPAQVFLDCYRTRALPQNLDIYVGVPEEFFIAPDTQEIYTSNVLIPILDDGNFGLVTFFNPVSKELVQMYVEAPELQVTFRCWQQYLARLLVRISESVDDDSELHDIACLIGFSSVKDFSTFLTQSRSLTGEEYESARQKFIHSISA